MGRLVGRVEWIWGSLLAGVLALGLAGCGDTNVLSGLDEGSGRQAQIEAGVSAIDADNWTEAIAIFEAMDPDDPEVQKYLASAHMGNAGFDVLDLIDLIAQAQDAGASDSVLYDSAVGIFGDANGQVSSEGLQAKLDDLLVATGTLTAAASDDSLKFQRGLYAAVDAVAVIGTALGLPDVSVPAIQQQTGGVILPDYTTALAERLATDAGHMAAAVVSQTNNDVSADLQTFLDEVGYSDDNAISLDELTNYLNSL